MKTLKHTQKFGGTLQERIRAIRLALGYNPRLRALDALSLRMLEGGSRVAIRISPDAVEVIKLPSSPPATAAELVAAELRRISASQSLKKEGCWFIATVETVREMAALEPSCPDDIDRELTAAVKAGEEAVYA